MGARHQDVVAPGGVLGVHAEGIVLGDMPDADIAERAVGPREAERPVPLLADRLELLGLLGDGDELPPDHQPRREHGGHADAGDHRQPPFEPGVFRIVVRPAPLAVAETDQAQRHEQVRRHEHQPGDDKRDVDGEVDRSPVRRQGREIPRAEEVKQQAPQHQDDQRNC